MTEIIRLVKLLLKDTYRSSKADRGVGRIGVYALIGVVYIMFEFAIITTLIGLAPLFQDKGMVPEFLTAVMSLGLTAVTTLGIMPMLSLLYFSKDSEFFLSLPIAPSKIYFAKLASVYITQLAITAAILLPALFAIGIKIGLSWAFFMVMILAVLVLPVFPLMAISIICLPLMYVIKFFKNRGAAASVVAMALFIAIFVAYMLLVNSTSNMPEADMELMNILDGPINRIASFMIPLTAINRFATFTRLEGYSEAISMLLNFFIFIVPALIMFVITLIISRRAYHHAVMAQLENNKRSNSGSIYQQQSGKMKALILKEWKGIIRTPVFTLQCFIGLIMMPVVLIVMGVSGGMEMDGETAIQAYAYWFIIVMMIQIIVVSTNIGASTSFSRDGGAFYLNKLLPIPYNMQIKAKILFFNIIYVADITLCFIIQFIILGFEAWWVGLLLYAYLLIINYGFINLCIIMDLSKPKLDWKSYREIVKNSRNAVLPMLIGVGIAVVLGVLSITLLFVLHELITIRLSAMLISALLLGAASAFAFITRNILRTHANKFFERIEG